MPHPDPEIVVASDQALLVRFGDAIDPAASEAVLAFFRALQRAPVPGVLDLHPAYTSLLVRFDGRVADPASMAEEIRARLHDGRDDEPAGRRIEIPVRYGGDDGPDLAEVARLTALSETEVIARHAAATYRVAFLGFSPGFPYLEGLPPELAVPRLDTPRTRVPAGSVAIAGAQAGVYPSETPGGWRLIGRTDLPLLRPDDGEPTLLRPGDRVRFVPLER